MIDHARYTATLLVKTANSLAIQSDRSLNSSDSTAARNSPALKGTYPLGCLHGRRCQPAAVDAPAARQLLQGVERDQHAVVGGDQAQWLDDHAVDLCTVEKLGVAGNEQRRVC